jgi:hypothetical protein
MPPTTRASSRIAALTAMAISDAEPESPPSMPTRASSRIAALTAMAISDAEPESPPSMPTRASSRIAALTAMAISDAEPEIPPAKKRMRLTDMVDTQIVREITFAKAKSSIPKKLLTVSKLFASKYCGSCLACSRQPCQRCCLCCLPKHMAVGQCVFRCCCLNNGKTVKLYIECLSITINLQTSSFVSGMRVCRVTTSGVIKVRGASVVCATSLLLLLNFFDW